MLLLTFISLALITSVEKMEGIEKAHTQTISVNAVNKAREMEVSESIAIQNISDLPYITRDYSQEEVKELIRQYAKEYDVPVDTALNVAKCESGYGQYKKNPKSSASGVYQITRATVYDANKHFNNYDVFDAKENIEMAMWFMANGQYFRWNESKHCWK